jgi:HAD superfamily hydrolase (TIGR01509 family)
MRTRAVILDVGGVLARDMWENIYDDLALQYRLDRAKLHEAGRLLWETFAYVPETPDNTWRDMERRYWELFLLISQAPTTVDALIALTDRYVMPVPGMLPLVEKLRARGVPLVICSNNTEIWWLRQVEKLRLDRLVDPTKMILSSRIGASKGSPRLEMFRAAVSAAGVPPDECFFVDDRAEYIARAKSYGIDAVLFQGPAHFAAELEKRGL